MHAGATLSRRFTLLRPGTYDLPGVERWVAHDQRRAVDVHVDLLTSSAPGEVRQAAVQAAQVRDLRFARVLATGREPLGGQRVTYIVTETPRAVPLTAFAHQRIVPPAVAAAIVSEAAHALEAAASADVHHGFLRPEALHVTTAGRVIISGLGIDGHLASQADMGEGYSEKADAQALARLYLTLVTGLSLDEVAVGDLPEHLSLRAADMARSTIAGRAPTHLAAVGRALSPADARHLRDLPRALTDWPWVRGAQAAATPVAPPLDIEVTFEPHTLERAGALAGLAAVALYATPELTTAVRAGHIDRLLPAPEETLPGAAHFGKRIPVSAEEAKRFSARTRRAVARQGDQELGLDTWEVIAAEQNSSTPPSVVQAVLEWLQRRWPRSVSLDTAAEQARHRARRPAPLRTGPIVVSMFLAITLVAAVVAFEVLTTPLSDQRDTDAEPPSHYPEFTFSPEPPPSPEPSPDPEGEENGDE